MSGICTPIGDIDLVTAVALVADLRSIIDGADDALVAVDCSRVTFMDSAAYHALVEATGYAARRGHTLILRNLSPADTTLLRLCDFAGELRIEPSSQLAPTPPTEHPFIDPAHD